MEPSTDSVEHIKRKLRAYREPQPARAKNTAAIILESAQKILVREGRKGLSARKLAKECGLSTGSIYGNFPSISAVLYALYRDRMEKDLAQHRKFYGQDTGDSSVSELIEAFAKEDARMECGGRLDLELAKAIEEDANLRRLRDHNMMLQREMLFKALRRRNDEASDSQLLAQASYMQGLSRLAFELRHVSNVDEKELVLDITLDLVKRVANFPR